MAVRSVAWPFGNAALRRPTAVGRVRRLSSGLNLPGDPAIESTFIDIIGTAIEAFRPDPSRHLEESRP